MLRTRTRALLDRAEAGERITITVDGRPIARLGPVAGRARWMSRREFIEQILARQADSGFAADLTSLTDGTADGLQSA